MGVLQKNWRHILQFLVINLVGWFFDIALAQVDAVAKAFDSLNFPLEAITCLFNLLAFSLTLIRGRFDLENGAREVLATLRGPKLENLICIQSQPMVSREESILHTGGLQAASVVMLSNGKQNPSVRQFIKFNAVDDVHSILLQYLPLNYARDKGIVTVDNCATNDDHRDQQQCRCIVFWTVQEISIRVARVMPGILKHLTDSMCLLPCLTCLKNGCHECDRGMLHVVPTDQLREKLTEGEPSVESPAVICKILNDQRGVQSINAREPICICIPLNDARDDDWTELLINKFRSKDDEARGVRVMASEALQQYLDNERDRGYRQRVLDYNMGSFSFIGPRFLEILINFVLTFWFRVDGFSSSLVARRAVRDYLLDSNRSGLAANAFLTKATVHFNADHNHVCQVLTFRGNPLNFRTLSWIAGGVNLICFIGWALFIAFDYGDSAPPLSTARVVVILAVIGIAWCMDCLYMYANYFFFNKGTDYKVLSVIISEMACIVAGSVVARALGIKFFRKVLNNWVYIALQVLVWVKWVIGSYILEENSRESSGYKYDDWHVLVFSSAFLLNAALAGVRTKWKPSWPWKKNHLFSKSPKS